MDVEHLCGGNQNAKKIAGHEFKSLLSLIRLNIPHLHVPLTVILTYCGYCVMITSVLPIDNSTLCYGSSNAGLNIYDKKPALTYIMRQASTLLNLKPHTVNGCKVYGPVDIGKE